jgi:hypothetical protein
VVRHAIRRGTPFVLALCATTLLGCGYAQLDADGQAPRAASGKADSAEVSRLEGVVEVAPGIGTSHEPIENGVGWLYNADGAALQPFNRARWITTLDLDRCWFHDHLEKPIGDQVILAAGHVCHAVLPPRPEPTRYILASMLFADGSGIQPPAVSSGTYQISTSRQLYTTIRDDCRGRGSPGDRVSAGTSGHEPSLTVECTDADGIRFTYFAYLPLDEGDPAEE